MVGYEGDRGFMGLGVACVTIVTTKLFVNVVIAIMVCGSFFVCFSLPRHSSVSLPCLGVLQLTTPSS